MTTPKKSLGQNFLRDEKVLRKIIEAADLQADDFVIEIGPGEGALTEKLAERVQKIIAIEIDTSLIPRLKRKFGDTKNIVIIEGDVLKINLHKLLGSEGSTFGVLKVEPSRNPQNYKVVANIPYYITSPIIRLFLESEFPPAEMILMVQKEVAERIVAKPGQMSLLTLAVQYYAQAELLFIVDRKSFYPAPEVDSAVIRITPSPPSPLPIGERVAEGRVRDKKFFRLARAGFSAKRKTLLNNLSSGLHLDKAAVEEKLKTAGLKPTARAQELSVEDWKKLSTLL